MGTETWTKIKKGILKIWHNNHFTSGCNLKYSICTNKSKLLPNSFPGVYQLDCTCSGFYFGKTKKKANTRTIEHQQDSFNGKWESSGATEHCLECHGQFNWINPKTFSTEQQYHRRKKRVIRN